MASFRSGNFDLALLSAHVRWGEGGEKARLPEIELLADWVATHTAAKSLEDKDLLVVGDFNIPSLREPMYRALSERGLKMPAALAGVPGSNLARSKRYDQILHLPSFSQSFTGRGGVVDFYADDHRALYATMGAARDMSLHAFTYELSDHLPLWVQINTDSAADLRAAAQTAGASRAARQRAVGR